MASTSQIRTWAREHSLDVPDRGRVPQHVVLAFEEAQVDGATTDRPGSRTVRAKARWDWARAER